MDTVNAAIRQYIDTSTAQFVFIGANAEELSKALIDNTASPMTYNRDKPQSLRDEDKVIEKLPLQLRAENVRPVNANSMFKQANVIVEMQRTPRNRGAFVSWHAQKPLGSSRRRIASIRNSICA